MKIIKPHFNILNMPEGDQVLRHLELAARTCYKSEDKIVPGSAAKLLKTLVKSGHHSVLEHVSVSVRIVCDRGITHELVRHRLCSFSQESTRYANYSKGKFDGQITVIEPFFWPKDPKNIRYILWKASCEHAEIMYMRLLEHGATAQEARTVLPTCLKAEIITTANLREWMHIFKLRCASASHPQIRQIMLPLLDQFAKSIPVLFDALLDKYREDIIKFANDAPLANIGRLF